MAWRDDDKRVLSFAAKRDPKQPLNNDNARGARRGPSPPLVYSSNSSVAVLKRRGRVPDSIKRLQGFLCGVLLVSEVLRVCWSGFGKHRTQYTQR